MKVIKEDNFCCDLFWQMTEVGLIHKDEGASDYWIMDTQVQYSETIMNVRIVYCPFCGHKLESEQE